MVVDTLYFVLDALNMAINSLNMVVDAFHLVMDDMSGLQTLCNCHPHFLLSQPI
jgi:hypothetical protein